MRAALTLCLLTFGAATAAPARAGNAVGRKQTIEYLQKLQTSSGGFLPAAGKKPASLRATSAAVRAIHYLGGTVQNRDAVARFVADCYDSTSGGFADTPGGKPDIFVTAVALMAVAALDMPGDKFVPGGVKYLDKNATTFEDVRIAVAGLEAVKQRALRPREWERVIRANENFDGSYGKDAGRARATASAVVAILRLGGSVEDQVVVNTALQEGQHKDGGWGKDDEDIKTDLESSYRVMRALVMLKKRPAGLEAIRSYVARCRNDDGGYGLAPGHPSTVPATYYAAIINHWAEQFERQKD
jgi:hypothetical protein